MEAISSAYRRVGAQMFRRALREDRNGSRISHLPCHLPETKAAPRPLMAKSVFLTARAVTDELLFAFTWV